MKRNRKHSTILYPKIFHDFPEIVAGMSTRLGGVSREPFGMNVSLNVGDDENNVLENRKIFFSRFNVFHKHVAIPLQEHTNTVRIVDEPGEYQHCDALITSKLNLFLIVTIADCVPILLYDDRKKIVAAVHAGWRGAKSGIIRNTIENIYTHFRSSPSDIKAFLGPSAGVCCYQVGPDVASHFKENVLRERNSSVYFNIKAEIQFQLKQEGIAEHNIEVNPDCTICNLKMYHSFRRDGKNSGRMMAMIGLVERE